MDVKNQFEERTDTFFRNATKIIERKEYNPKLEEIGFIKSLGKGVAVIEGLPSLEQDEIVLFAGGNKGIVFNLEEDYAEAVLLCQTEILGAGDEVKRSGMIADIPVGEELIGRVINPLGEVLDGGIELSGKLRLPIERDAPSIIAREQVNMPLQTGIIAIDSMIPIGKGQRELIIGDRQLGKTSIAVNAIINQKGKDVICIYCSIGQQSTGVAKILKKLRDTGAIDYTIVVVAAGDESPGMNFIAPYAATSIGEYFMENGKDVLIIYDDLGKHARSYREISLLLRRAPAREAYPGDIFYIHSRLLERSAKLNKEHGGGSMTALPIMELEGENLSAYIPTNLVSITDGQIYLSSKMFSEGLLPAIDTGKSVSRVGGKAQVSAYREAAGNLKLTYSQFEELEIFERFGSRLDDETKNKLVRGHRIRSIMCQREENTLDVAEQIVLIISALSGVFDTIEENDMEKAKKTVGNCVKYELNDITEKIKLGNKLDDGDKNRIKEIILGKLLHLSSVN